MDQVEYGAILFVHWYQWSDLAFHWYKIGEMHLIKGTSYIFLMGQVEYGGIPSSIGTNGTIGTNRVTWHSIGTRLVKCISLRALRIFS